MWSVPPNDRRATEGGGGGVLPTRGEEEVKMDLKKLHKELKDMRGGERGDRRERGDKKKKTPGIM